MKTTGQSMDLVNFKNYLANLKPPTEEENYNNGKRWWEMQYPTSFFSWNDILLANSPGVFPVHIPKHLAHNMLRLPEHPDWFEGIVQEVEQILSNSGIDVYNLEKYFVKSTIRSPKDSDEYCKFSTVSGLLNAMIGSVRVFEDFCLLYYVDKCYFIFRPRVDFEKRNEWRVLIDNNQVTITQYHFTEFFNYTEHEINNAESIIRDFIALTVKPNIELKQFVADIIIINDVALLLETNPFGLSDPCLYWSYDQLDGKMRWVKSVDEIVVPKYY